MLVDSRLYPGLMFLDQEPYRGKGIAKAIATKVMREHSFGDDGWG